LSHIGFQFRACCGVCLNTPCPSDYATLSTDRSLSNSEENPSGVMGYLDAHRTA